MFIRISNDLKQEHIFANGRELAGIMGKDRVEGKRVYSYPEEDTEFVHTFEDPVLITDNYRISKLEPTLRETLFSLFTSRPRTIEYDGVSVVWGAEYPTVWCPSIDTVLFAKALREIFSSEHKLTNAVEIGCGSGFLSKYVLSKVPTLQNILITDINPEAVKCAQSNINDSRASFLVGDGLEALKNNKYDLVISNPPYVPRPDAIEDNPYEGLEVINFILENVKTYLNPGGVSVLNVSSLCEDLVLSKQTELNFSTICSLRVPLKVNNILNNKDWMAYLLTRGLEKNLHDGYEYWQTIKILKLEI